MMDIDSILIELCSLPGPSGFEEPVAERISEMLKQYMDDVQTDIMGNITAVRRCGKENAKKLLFDAHMDENGIIVVGCEEGFLRFAALGGIDARQLPAAEVTILTDPPLFGVIGTLPPHVLKKEDTEKTEKIENLFIDIGLTQEEAEKAVPIGTPGVFIRDIQRLGADKLCGKALDDRAGIASILYALELLKDERLDLDLYVLASVQEEVGVRGAAPGVYNIDPDLCVVIDVGHAKTPDTKTHEVTEKLGGGVIVSRGPNMNTRFTEKVINIARDKNIKFQIDVEPGGNSGTNARAIQVSRAGVATALFGIPLKYMHSTNEVVSINDIKNTAKLLCETAKSLRGE